jgi:hypothetical protein
MILHEFPGLLRPSLISNAAEKIFDIAYTHRGRKTKETIGYETSPL